MYVAVKGGEQAILNSWAALARKRRGDTAIPEITVNQIREQLGLAVDRVMAEGSLYDPELAALALKQAQGDIAEAIFLLRAYRTTLPRFGGTGPIDTGSMRIHRRISATFKDIPGGQILGPTYDYTQRLLDFDLLRASPLKAAGDEKRVSESTDELTDSPVDGLMPRVTGLMGQEGLVEAEHPPEGDPDPPDITRDPLEFPASRPARLQNLARGDEGFLLALAYSSQRGYSYTHPFAAEIRHGTAEVEMVLPELGFPVVIGEIEITECQMVNQFKGSATEPAKFTRGYGLTFGHCERKTMAMALVDRSLRADELGEQSTSPAQQQEFVLSHSDSVEASGFVQHLKLPHYVDFQSELELLRRLRSGVETTEGAGRT